MIGQGGSYLMENGELISQAAPAAQDIAQAAPAAQDIAQVAPAAQDIAQVAPELPAIDLAAIAGGTAADAITSLPGLSSTQLAELASLEAAGKNRVTVLDAIASFAHS